MKIVRVVGGLGNQMFQYALLIGLKKLTNDIVKIDLSPISTYNRHNGFELEKIFNLTSQIATKEEVKKLGRYYHSYRQWQICHHLFPIWRKEFVERKFFRYYPQVLKNADKDRIYDGYWQCYKYFDHAYEDIVKEYSYKNEFSKKNKDLAERMLSNSKSVSIHVRRGDYLKSKEYNGICEIDYYQRAIAYMKKTIGDNADVFVFSNDIKWCKTNILPLLDNERVTFVDWNVGEDSYNDMRLMHHCRVNIIAASSFSWWGAYLNQRKDRIVIAPRKWINLPMEYEIQLPDWIKL